RTALPDRDRLGRVSHVKRRTLRSPARSPADLGGYSTLVPVPNPPTALAAAALLCLPCPRRCQCWSRFLCPIDAFARPRDCNSRLAGVQTGSRRAQVAG